MRRWGEGGRGGAGGTGFTQLTIKVLENTYTKNLRLKIEFVIKMDGYFNICQYKLEEPTNTKIFALISLKV